MLMTCLKVTVSFSHVVLQPNLILGRKKIFCQVSNPLQLVAALCSSTLGFLISLLIEFYIFPLTSLK